MYLKKILPIFLGLIAGLLSGCAYSTIPVLNNIVWRDKDGLVHPTKMVYSDDTGTLNEEASTGSFVHIPENVYLGYSGVGYNVIVYGTMRFYKLNGTYLGATTINFYGGYGNYNGWGWSYLYGQFIINSITQPSTAVPVYDNPNYPNQ